MSLFEIKISMLSIRLKANACVCLYVCMCVWVYNLTLPCVCVCVYALDLFWLVLGNLCCLLLIEKPSVVLTDLLRNRISHKHTHAPTTHTQGHIKMLQTKHSKVIPYELLHALPPWPDPFMTLPLQCLLHFLLQDFLKTFNFLVPSFVTTGYQGQIQCGLRV